MIFIICIKFNYACLLNISFEIIPLDEGGGRRFIHNRFSNPTTFEKVI